MGTDFYFLAFDYLLALTPAERWGAAGRQFHGSFHTETWIIYVALAGLVVLIALLWMVSSKRTVQEQHREDRLFSELAKKRGISPREYKMLLKVSDEAGLKEKNAIFTMENAFDRGVSHIVKEHQAKHQGSERSEQLRSEMSFLREKLGFGKKRPSSASPKTEQISSRQVPVGKKVRITRRQTRNLDEIEATVVENNDMALTVKSAMPVKVIPGEFWRVRYYFGASVWEFDSTAISCIGDILVLNHSDDVRFINRRRFLRVPVNDSAFIARFPFEKTLTGHSGTVKGDSEAEQAEVITPDNSWGPPQFVPCVVTELAGPGLRIETPMELKTDDKVLVVMKLDEQGGRDSDRPDVGDKSEKIKIVEGVGEIRHAKAVENGFSVAVELTGLVDSEISELIRATNLASLKAGDNKQADHDSKESQKKPVEQVSVQGT